MGDAEGATKGQRGTCRGSGSAITGTYGPTLLEHSWGGGGS